MLEVNQSVFDSDYVPQLFHILSNCLQEAYRLPAAEDFAFFSSFPDFQEGTSEQLAEIGLLNELAADLLGLRIRSFSDVQTASALCLQKVELALEALEEPSAEGSQREERVRPQGVVFDNSEYGFIPKIREKYHSKVPISGNLEFLQEFRVGDGDNQVTRDLNVEHPYRVEIEELQYSALQCPGEYPDLAGTSVVQVSDVEGLQHCIKELARSSEIAVHLEEHTERSYYGFTCFVVIAVRGKDFLVDCLGLYSQMHLLGEVFADPAIVKILHRAESTVLPLQRDFGLYIVNLVDTELAARELGYPSTALPFLLKSFCDIDQGKSTPTDWRTRPLTEEMSRVLTRDTHFLLYIYSKLQAEVTEPVGLFGAFKAASLVTYAKPVKALPVHMEEPRKQEQIKGLAEFRDLIARTDDECPECVLPSAALFSLVCYAPNTAAQLLSIDSSLFTQKHQKYILKLLSEPEHAQSQSTESDLFAAGGWRGKRAWPQPWCFDSKECIGPEVFANVCQSVEEVAVAVNLLRTLQSANTEYVTKSEICPVEALHCQNTESELDFSDFELALESTVIDEDSIPSSMHEIYELSNKNRKKNKKHKCCHNAANSPWCGKPAFRALFNQF